MAKTNLINYLKNKYEDIDIVIETAPSFIKRLSDIEDTIIFICKKRASFNGHESPKLLHSSMEVSENESNNPSLDITGSPLKDECEIDLIDTDLVIKPEYMLWTEKEAKYIPIPIQLGREILNEINLYENIDQNLKDRSVWVLCEEIETPLIEVSLLPKYFSRGIVHYKETIRYEEINPENLQKLIPNNLKTKKLATTIESVYNIQPNVQIIVQYPILNSAATNFFEISNNSDVKLSQNLNLNILNKNVSHMWKDLQLLNISYESSSNYDMELSTQSFGSLDVDLLKRRISDVLAGSLNRSTFQESDENQTKEHKTDLHKNVDNTKNKFYVNVTDNLWDLLKDYLTDSKSLMITVFECAAKVTPDISEPINHLSKLLMEIAKCPISIPHLIHNEPLHLLLIDAGIDKLFRDYESILVESHICTSNDLKLKQDANNKCLNNEIEDRRNTLRKTLFAPQSLKKETTDIFPNNNEGINAKVIANKLAKLGQMHLILEHLLLAQSSFNIKSLNIGIFKKLFQEKPLPLNKLLQLDSHHLEIPIYESGSILTLVKKTKPNFLKISMSSEEKSINVKNMFYFSVEPIFPYYIKEEDVIEFLGKDTTKQELFHYFHYIKINTRKFD